MYFTNAESDFEWRQDQDEDQGYLVPRGGWQVYDNEMEIENVLNQLLLQSPR